jgi:hypothetical protein
MKRDEIRCRHGEEKTRALIGYPVPTSVTEIRQFMGLYNFFRKYIINFSIIAEPLHGLTRKAAQSDPEALSQLRVEKWIFSLWWNPWNDSSITLLVKTFQAGD